MGNFKKVEEEFLTKKLKEEESLDDSGVWYNKKQHYVASASPSTTLEANRLTM